MGRNFDLSIGEFYHIYNRGNDKRSVFLEPKDYLRFFALLYLCNTKKIFHLSEFQGSTLGEILRVDKGAALVDIGAYCLMPNHFHVLIHEKTEGGISLFIQKVSTGYTMYFNKKYQRSGALFQGRFKAKHADTDEYLKYLFSYIHLNPVKLIEPEWKEKGIIDQKKAKEYLNKYPYSSYHDFIGKIRSERVILNREAFPEYFETKHDFEDCLKDWLEYSDEFTLENTKTKVEPSDDDPAIPQG